jgi:hypothetical protein
MVEDESGAFVQFSLAVEHKILFNKAFGLDLSRQPTCTVLLFRF